LETESKEDAELTPEPASFLVATQCLLHPPTASTRIGITVSPKHMTSETSTARLIPLRIRSLQSLTLIAEIYAGINSGTLKIYQESERGKRFEVFNATVHKKTLMYLTLPDHSGPTIVGTLQDLSKQPNASSSR
jgi:hypothetical protein